MFPSEAWWRSFSWMRAKEVQEPVPDYAFSIRPQPRRTLRLG